ncbi:LamG domain-containing protein [Hymenobacter aerilatus]|uniref:LamG domain-containing protein n=1 Tax=Hymenobacter aerilatus TaxID=2932251 RepID=A0A8T9T2E0_9BACT|nr:LamG domain-containing protein [Hymenobacter aerilatus]UOR06730.1 LamG domain-containing protein [Hymenobacter aerilatus]
MSLRRAFFAGLALAQAPVVPIEADVAWSPAFTQNGAILAPARIGEVLGTSSYTFECWLYTTFQDGFSWVGGYDDVRNRFSSHIPFQGRIYFDSGDITNGGRMEFGYFAQLIQTWNHIAVQVDTATNQMRFYLNGELYYQQTGISLRLPTNDVPFVFGYQGQSYLSEIRYWDLIRTPQQLKADMAISYGNGVGRTGLRFCWRGNETGETGTLVRDRSGNNLHALLN